MWNLALQPLKTYFHYYNAYDHQTWQGGDLYEELPTIKTTFWWRGLARSHDKLKTSQLPECLWQPNLAGC